ncbi:MAG: hypothetical protein ACO1QB_11315, partial [Verrucomicrobiales bacterium]
PHKIISKPGFPSLSGPDFAPIMQRSMGEIDPSEVIAACEELSSQLRLRHPFRSSLNPANSGSLLVSN